MKNVNESTESTESTEATGLAEAELPARGQCCVYMLRCRDGSLYTGWTNDLQKRLRSHSSGTGSKYTGSRLPVHLAYWEACPDKIQAMRREYAIKQLSRTEKEDLIRDFCGQPGAS